MQIAEYEIEMEWLLVYAFGFAAMGIGAGLHFGDRDLSQNNVFGIASACALWPVVLFAAVFFALGSLISSTSDQSPKGEDP